VDFYVKALGLVIEIDGISHENKVEYDEKRQLFLKQLGLKVFRVTDEDVKSRIVEVMELLENYIIREYGINH
jgi:very-short-patch-repair endonuclease